MKILPIDWKNNHRYFDFTVTFLTGSETILLNAPAQTRKWVI